MPQCQPFRDSLYVRPATDRGIVDHFAAIRVKGFGPPTAAERDQFLFLPIGMSSPLSISPIAAGLFAFLILPSILLLVIGMSAASSVRDRRFAVLGWLGASPRTLRRLATLEALVLALPGLVAAVIVGGLLTPSLEHVPLVGDAVRRGDLGLPSWLLALLLVLGVAAIGVITILTTAVRGRRASARPRPATGRPAISPLRVAPLGVAVGCWVAWLFTRQSTLAPTFFYAGVVVALASVPLVLPTLVGPAGVVLARLGPVPALLAGRYLAWDPVRTARPFLGFGVLVSLALATTGYIAFLTATPATPSNEGTPSVLISWHDPRPDDLADLETALTPSFVAPIELDEETLVIGASCAALSAFIPDIVCQPSAPYHLPIDEAPSFSALFLQPGAEVRLAAATTLEQPDGAIVLDPAVPVDILEERVRNVAMFLFPAPRVMTNEPMANRTSPLVAWLAAGIGIALATLAVACVLAMIDRLLATRQHRRHLLHLGLLPRQLATIEIWQFVAPYSVVLTAGAAVGLALCAQIVVPSHDAATPWRAISWTLGLAVLAGTVGVGSIAVFSIRTLRDRPRAEG